jgi:hypothetical protein
MRPVPSITIALLFALATTACSEEGLHPVRATMDDGQVLMGAVSTPELLLEGGMGTIAIPWEDVGEVVPVEGEGLMSAGGYVDVWLRNGSELTGRWVDAELAMELAVGGETLAVDVPVDPLLRLQTQGGEVWPQGLVYRVRTSHGDDFLVDPDASRLVIENEMGSFAPFLSECVSAAPVEDPTGDWRVELITGTVLIGPISDSAITFSLPMGPEEASVPLEKLVSLERQDWGGYPSHEEGRFSDRLMRALPRPSATKQVAMPAATAYEPEAPAEQAADGRFGDTGGLQGGVGDQQSADGWFSNRRLQQVKAMH